jgi:chromosome partitioning protein
LDKPRPWRPEGLPAKVAAVASFKGGVGKTSTAAHLALSAELDGYRVLVVDLDSQCSMTSALGDLHGRDDVGSSADFG